jgi:hypothetical protein
VKITVPVNNPATDFGLEADAEAPQTIETVKTKTINVFEKFQEFMYELEQEGYRVRKIVMHHEIYRLMRQSNEYQNLVRYHRDGDKDRRLDQILGVKVKPKELGHESITDFIIYTDRKVVHSEMLEKTFLEDVDDKQLVDNLEVEELIHETNQRVEDREK